MIDPIIKLPNGKRLPYSEIVLDTESRLRHLARFCELDGESGQASCLCVPGGVPMGIALRTRPVKTCYLYELHRNDREKHLPSCMYRILSESGAGADEREMPVAIRNGQLIINVGCSLYRNLRDGEPGKESSETREKVDEKERKEPARVPLEAVASALWMLSELNRWRPQWEGKRSYAVVRRRLVEASKKILLRKNTPLASRFYCPPKFAPDRKETNRAELEQFVAAISTLKGKRLPFGVFCGVVREIVFLGDSLILRLAHSLIGLEIGAERYLRRVRRLCPEGGAEQTKGWFVIAVVEPGDVEGAIGRSSTLAVTELGLLRLTEGFLPCFSDRHEKLLDELREQGHSFHVPLHYGLQEEEVQAAAVLEDGPAPRHVLLRDLAVSVESLERHKQTLELQQVEYELPGEA